MWFVIFVACVIAFGIWYCTRIVDDLYNKPKDDKKRGKKK